MTPQSPKIEIKPQLFYLEGEQGALNHPNRLMWTREFMKLDTFLRDKVSRKYLARRTRFFCFSSSCWWFPSSISCRKRLTCHPWCGSGFNGLEKCLDGHIEDPDLWGEAKVVPKNYSNFYLGISLIGNLLFMKGYFCCCNKQPWDCIDQWQKVEKKLVGKV